MKILRERNYSNLEQKALRRALALQGTEKTPVTRAAIEKQKEILKNIRKGKGSIDSDDLFRIRWDRDVNSSFLEGREHGNVHDSINRKAYYRMLNNKLDREPVSVNTYKAVGLDKMSPEKREKLAQDFKWDNNRRQVKRSNETVFNKKLVDKEPVQDPEDAKIIMRRASKNYRKPKK